MGSACMDRDILQDNKITHILTVSDEFPPAHPKHFDYMVVHISDEPRSNLIQVFHETTRFIEEGRKNGNVFIHCAAGISRSPTVTLAYLLLSKLANSPEEAIELIKKSRYFVSPNSGFWKQIQIFYNAGFDDTHQLVANHLKSILPKPKITYHGKNYPEIVEVKEEEEDDDSE
uniref:Protein-tyrosine-phosphatase n=1 Tax=Arcella intermedia TaxID=1963864 RepID=A0A6B2LLF1_9EUKA